MLAMQDMYTLQELTDPQLLEEYCHTPEAVVGKVTLALADGKIMCARRQMFLNLFWWPVLTQFNVPICKRHFIRRTPLTNDSLTEAWNKYFDEIATLYPQRVSELVDAFWNVLQKLYVFTYTSLNAYTCTIDIMDIAEMMHTPRMQEILASKEKITIEMGTNAIEKYIDSNSKEIMNLMGTKGALDNEAFYPYQQLKQLNKFQIPQTMYAFGVRTDISDAIISKPVIGSAIDGLRDAQEYAIESLSAKKSIFYNKMNVPDSQYHGRKQHLAASSVEHIYPGDCGSTVYVDFNVTEVNAPNIVGKYIVEGGKLVVLTKDNVKNYINTTIHMRSPMTCRYRDGVCEVCGGKIISNLDKKMNIGIIAAIQVIEPTTQKILSAKHLIKTNSIVYELPDVTNKVLLCATATDIRWRPEVAANLDALWMGVPLKSFSGQIEDVNSLRSDKEIHEERFSAVPYFILRNDKTEVAKVYPLDIGNGRLPFFSKEMLLHIRDNFLDMKTDDVLRWIPLKNTARFPIFKTVVVNDNMQTFVKNVQSFLGSKIAGYSSCSQVLQHFSDIVYSKVSANIVMIEVLLKAYEVVSTIDYAIPLVEDPNAVKFQSTAKILCFRHVGVELAFEGLKRYLMNPSSYLVTKGRSPFDLMVGFTGK